MKKGIDISEHQGSINWEIVKDQINFCIIRVSYGKSKIDKYAIRNIESCIKYNIPFGVYLYSYALNLSDAVSEANLVIRTIRDYKDYVKFICVDMEDADKYKAINGMPSNEMLCDICVCEFKVFENYGYTPMLYASKSWYDTKLNLRSLDGYKKWLAWWNDKAKFNKEKYEIWQYTSNGEIAGIEGRVDLNMCYSDIFETEKEILKKDVNYYPDYARDTLNKLIEKDILKGENGLISLGIDSVRILVIMDRLGLI